MGEDPQRDVSNGFCTLTFRFLEVMIALKQTLIYSEPIDISWVLSVLKEGVDARSEYSGIKH